MMTNQFEYKGYVGSAEVDVESQTLFGRLLFIRDVIGYSADSPKELENAFREAVDDYLETCANQGDEPEKPFKGSFNVRVGPEIHRDVALAARRKNVGLNDYVCGALTDALSAERAVRHVHHHHELTVQLSSEPKQRVASGLPPSDWERIDVAAH
jgi:predicted HicB family RNase H-like nuclease